jgi:predicted DNA-binding transcriptional regulator YafY
MNRIDRLTAIILLLQGGRRTAGEIARRFEVSKRTVFRDIEALCEMGVPIVTEAGAHGGYTLMPDYSLAPLQLTARETLLLRLALSSVSQLADTPFKQERESLLAKIQALLPARYQQDIDQLLQTIRLDIPDRNYATPFIEQLLESARTGQWLCISYRSERRTSEQTILPHRLYSAGGFWYCEAYSYERQEERTYRVDRFVAVSATQANSPSSPSGQAQGPHNRSAPPLAPTSHAPTTRRQPLPYDHPSHPEVRIRLTARGILAMERDPQLGNSIRWLDEEEGLLCFRCPSSEYDWLVRTLLSLGRDAEVLAPDVLRNLVRQAAQDVVNKYS